MKNCNEIFLKDVVRIDVYVSTSCSAAIPSTIGGITEISPTLSTPSFIISLNDISDSSSLVALMSSTPSIKSTALRDNAGYIYQHSLSVVVDNNINNIHEVIYGLRSKDLFIIYTTVDGDRYMVYSLPNTSVLTTEQIMGSSLSSTIKFSAKSMSDLIKVK